MSRADDGARPVLVGGAEEDAGIASHGVTRASMLRPGQQLVSNNIHGPVWYTIKTVELADGEVIAKTGDVSFIFPEADMVPVRDILHTYTETKESKTQ
jgi:hypothetical protein